MGEPLPALLTVEEAARLLRIGRTKAYALTREWRDTGGKTGLPVVDFGSVLRVPRRAARGAHRRDAHLRTPGFGGRRARPTSSR